MSSDVGTDFPLHIAIFSRYLKPGGIEEVTVTLANRLADRGHRIDLILAKGKGRLGEDVSPNVNTINLSQNRVWMCVPKVRKYVLEEKPDSILSLQDRTNIVSIASCLLCGESPKKVVVDQINVSEYLERQKKVYGTIVKILVKIFYPFADAVIGASKGVIKDTKKLAKISDSRTYVIYNPVVSKELTTYAQKDPENAWLDSEKHKVILGVGRLHPQKNFPLLVRAFSKAYEDNPHLRLIILGEGSHRSEIESTIARLGLENVIALPGFESNPYSYMARADLFVLSSDYEGFGIVVAEALACGCPVVSTDCPSGPREILEDGKWGTLVPVGDADALAAAIIKSMSQEHNREAYRQRGAAFSVQRSVDAYEKVLLPE